MSQMYTLPYGRFQCGQVTAIMTTTITYQACVIIIAKLTV